jgi:hypothetical protein
MEEEGENINNLKEKLQEKFVINFDVLKIVLMIGMIFMFVVLSYVGVKYGSTFKSNPCDLCSCMKSSIQQLNYSFLKP